LDEDVHRINNDDVSVEKPSSALYIQNQK